MSDAPRGLVKPTIQITTLSFVGIILSFISQLVVAYFFGATPERDAYFAALVIPTYVSAVLTGSIGVMFLPMYVDIKTKRGKDEASRFLNNTASLGVLIAVVIVLGGILFSHEIVSATVPGFAGKQKLLTSELLVILLPTVMFQILASLIGSVLQVEHRFLLPALVPVISAAINFAAVVTFSRLLGIPSLAYSTLLGSIVTVCILGLSLSGETRLRLLLDFKNKDLLKLITVCLPLIGAAVIGRVSEIFERSLASSLEAGSISYLGYAKQLLIILTTIATSGLATSIFPTISKAWSHGDLASVRHYFLRCVQIIFLITIPVAALFIVLGGPIISLVFERGAFNHKTAINVSEALAILMGSFLSMSFGSILSKIVYFTQQTYYGLLIGFIEASVYLLSGYYLIRYFSFLGLAMASSLSTFVTIVTCLAVLTSLKILTKKELAKIGNILLINISVIIPLSCLLYGLYHVLTKYYDNFFATSISICVYIFLSTTIYMYLFPEVKQVGQLVLRRVIKRKSYA